MRNTIADRLKQLADEKYRDFQARLIPGLNKDRMLGVRLPQLRKLAKELVKGPWEDWLGQIENCGPDPKGIGGTELFYEEIMLQAMIIGAADMDRDARLDRIRRFLPRIDNWAVCDTFCGDLKFAGREADREPVWSFLPECLESGREYEIRFGLVMLLTYYIDDGHILRVLELAEKVRHDGYYVKMAAAWLLSVCFVKFPKETEALLQDGRLDDFTHNKTIQKIRESLRVSKEDKARLALLRACSRSQRV